MKNTNSTFSKFILMFFVTSGCICLLMGTLGLIIFPDQRFGYDAYFMPPIFAFLTCLPQFLLKRWTNWKYSNILSPILNLLIIEGIVVGLNFFGGTLTSVVSTLLLIFGIAVVYAIVSLVLHLNDKRIARDFNEQLALWQEQMNRTS